MGERYRRLVSSERTRYENTVKVSVEEFLQSRAESETFDGFELKL